MKVYPMKALAAIILALLTACAPGTSIYPSLYCTGSVAVDEEWSVAVEELREKCGVMVNVKIKSWSGE